MPGDEFIYPMPQYYPICVPPKGTNEIPVLFGSTASGVQGGQVEVKKLCVCGNEELSPVNTTDTLVTLEMSVDPSNMTHFLNATELFNLVNNGQQ